MTDREKVLEWALRRALAYLVAVKPAHDDVMKILRNNGLTYDKNGHLVQSIPRISKTSGRLVLPKDVEPKPRKHEPRKRVMLIHDDIEELAFGKKKR